MKKADKEVLNKDELGENIPNTKKEGLSTPEAEEAGDFVGTGKIRNREPIREGKGSAGSTIFNLDKEKTDTGTTGTNAKKDRNTENKTGGEPDKYPGFRQDDVIL